MAMTRVMGNQSNPNRPPTDLYPTPAAWTEVLLRHVDFRGPIWEPAAGNGDMVKVLEDHAYIVLATDLLTGHDFFKQVGMWDGSIVTNPPFKYADRFIDHAHMLATEQVAMLLGVGRLGGVARCHHLWRAVPPQLVIVVANRMKNIDGAAGQFNHMWVVWDQAVDNPTTRLEWDIAQ